MEDACLGSSSSSIQRYPEDITKQELRYHRKLVMVVKEFEFDAAHHLHEYEGKCQHLHGHRWKVQFRFVGEPDYRGLVVDFLAIKNVWKEHLEPLVDHRYLNTSTPKMNPTCENLVAWLYHKMEWYVPSLRPFSEDEPYLSLRLDSVRLYETPTGYVEYPVTYPVT